MRKISSVIVTIFFLVLITSFSVNADQGGANKKMKTNYPELTATIETSKGDIHVRLFPNQAPLTVLSFVNLAGHDDWRLPNAKELESLIYIAGNATIDKTYFPDAHGATYWSSTTCSHESAKSYSVDFSDRSSSCFDKILVPSYARCVRGGQGRNEFNRGDCL